MGFAGPHPAGNVVGVHIHHVAPIKGHRADLAGT
ncbi:MAG: hypothetical protein IPJ13_04860 [Saprospiraceae bacterium]|nr:hypothetical protein [Saprospiraceae bacterium]